MVNTVAQRNCGAFNYGSHGRFTLQRVNFNFYEDIFYQESHGHRVLVNCAEIFLQSLLHPVNQVPATLMPGDKNVPIQVPINRDYQAPPALVAPRRQEFQPVPAPVLISNTSNTTPVFSGKLFYTIGIVLDLLIDYFSRSRC